MKNSVKIIIVIAIIALTILIGYLGNSLVSQRQQVDTRATQEQRSCPVDGATCEWDAVVEATTNKPTKTPTPTKKPTTIPATAVPTDATISPTMTVDGIMYRVEVRDLTSDETILARTTKETKVTFTPQPDHEYRCTVSVVAECGTGDETSASNICRSAPSNTPTLTNTPTMTATPSATLTPTNTPTATPTSPPVCAPPNTCMPQLDCNLNGGRTQPGACPIDGNGSEQICCSIANNSPTPTATPTHTPVPTATVTPVPPTNTPAPTSPPPVITQVIVNVTRVIVQNQVVQGQPAQQEPQQPQQQPAQQQPTQPPAQPQQQLPRAGGGAWLVILAPLALILAGLAL